jgi:hypothetical protein
MEYVQIALGVGEIGYVGCVIRICAGEASGNACAQRIAWADLADFLRGRIEEPGLVCSNQVAKPNRIAISSAACAGSNLAAKPRGPNTRDVAEQTL